MKNTMKKRILIVEDDVSLSNVLQEKLASLEYDLMTVPDGEKIVEVTKSYAPDLILLDLVLPGRSGFEILEELKIKNKISTPVIILTNLNQPEDQKHGHDLGAIDYILKSNTSLKDISIKITKALS